MCKQGQRAPSKAATKGGEAGELWELEQRVKFTSGGMRHRRHGSSYHQMRMKREGQSML